MSKRFTLCGADVLGGGMSLLAVALLPLGGLMDETALQRRTREVAERRALAQLMAGLREDASLVAVSVPVPVPVPVPLTLPSPLPSRLPPPLPRRTDRPG